MSHQSLSSLSGKRVRLQPLPESAKRRIASRPLTEWEKQRLEHNKTNRAKSAIEDQKYCDWLVTHGGTYRQITGEFPPIPAARPADISVQPTVSTLPAVMNRNTDKIDLRTMPISVYIDYRLMRDGRIPKTINMCYSNMLRLLQERVLIQGCYRGRIPIQPNPRLAESEILIVY